MDTKRPYRGENGGPPAKRAVNIANHASNGINTGPGAGGGEDDLIEEQLAAEAEVDYEDQDVRMVEEDLDVELGEAGRNWERPPVPPHNPQATSLGGHCAGQAGTSLQNGTIQADGKRCCAAFQQLDVDYYIGQPNQQLHRTDLTEVPILRMFGVTATGAFETSSTQRLNEAQDRACDCSSGLCK